MVRTNYKDTFHGIQEHVEKQIEIETGMERYEDDVEKFESVSIDARKLIFQAFSAAEF